MSVAAPAAPLPLLFVMEKVLGHATHAENLRRAVESVEREEGVVSGWGEVTYWKEGGALEKKWLPWPIKGALRGVLQARSSYRGFEPAAQFVMFAIAGLLPDKLSRHPTVLTNDLTPVQLDRMGEFYGHRANGGGPLSRVKTAWMRRTFAQAAAFSVWSGWVKDSLVDDYGLDAGRIEVIPPGVDLAAFPCPDRSLRDPEAPVKVLFVGGHLERKGGRLLIEVARELLSKGPAGAAGRLELHLVTRDRVDEGDGVRVYNGVKPNDPLLLRLLDDADVFCLPTFGDAFSMASIEAMAAGLPVIAGRVGGIPDIVENGRTGFLIEPGDRAALADRLGFLVSDRGARLAMGRAGRERCEARFDHVENARRQLALLKRAAG